MSELKYKVGDKVRIKSLDWHNENKSKSHGTVACGGKYFDYDMREWCGKTMTILEAYQTCYIMREDGAKDLWTDEMIEGLAEEEIKFGTASNPIELKSNANCLTQERVKELSSESHNVWELPAGYQFVDENGNVINATKIILAEKKPKYPKTYDDCVIYDREGSSYNRSIKLSKLEKLLICRDAYWKIAGEEMGLGKLWEPGDNKVFGIIRQCGKIQKYDDFVGGSTILEFPTEEMRDTFKENFDPDIEVCKEFL